MSLLLLWLTKMAAWHSGTCGLIEMWEGGVAYVVKWFCRLKAKAKLTRVFNEQQVQVNNLTIPQLFICSFAIQVFNLA